MSATFDSDSYLAFGDFNPLAAVANVVNAYVASDIMASATPSIGNAATASLASSWLMDQLVNNSITVSLPDGVKKFARIPTTGSTAAFVPPPGDASTVQATPPPPGQATSTLPIILTDKSRNVAQFDTSGNITSWTDRTGNAITFHYSGTGVTEQLASVANTAGRTLTFAYNGSNQLGSVTDGSRTVHYTYDASGNLATYSDATAQQTTFSYQSGTPGFLTKIFYPNFPTTAFMTNVYDGFGRVLTQADALSNVWYYMFANGYRSQEVDPAGGTHILYFDARGNQFTDINQVNDSVTSVYDGVGH